MDNTYNGYANYETWNVCLWIDNEYGIYMAQREQFAGQTVSEEQAADFVMTFFPTGTPDFDSVGDYAKVDWSEVAESITETASDC